MTGLKFDNDKPCMDLLPPKAVVEVARVLTHGARKYGRHNWRELEGWDNRYIAAALRHIFAWLDKEQTDPESGLHHLAHAVCSLMFVIEKESES